MSKKLNPITFTTKIINSNLNLNGNLPLWLYYLLKKSFSLSSNGHKGLQYRDIDNDFNILGTTRRDIFIDDLAEADKANIAVELGTS